ncbi:3,4-dihydroxy-2-butanone-4-phosphate synthase [Mycobacterium sp. ITM-2016-00318]|uniref:3,4-dihydroxy-2-butanone-4-phosphate synthase n=1 Tax=Mycobacterium sp. ITM-2016-00318 TaxID=2099693 RepID=UPI000CF9479A|nr:3,4-dihydroxy-2-butanone-4-phosphate synthase [Mycobacterium sp. ITM-2016-00318]WNG93922.1 3,4-dihydroxy-2-butanone-4-phosphate synthase [Mycobacterium sp. ITM-2016-00318]
MRTTDIRVRRAIAAVTAGRPVVVTDDTSDDNDGHLVFAAEAATPKLLAFTVRHTSGYVRVALPGSECERLNLPPVSHARADYRVSVDWRGVGTGISATDRALTIARLVAPGSEASHFRRPGHVVPQQAADQGVLERSGVAEAAVDLARLGGRRAAAGLCEIVSRKNRSAMAHGAELLDFADEYGLQVVTIAELAAYRRRTEPQVIRVAETVMPIRGGNARVIGYRGLTDNAEHLAVIVGAAGADMPVLLHVHLECLTGDVFGGLACRCGRELDSALALMAAQGGGVIVYLRPSGPLRGCGLETGAQSASPDHGPETVAWILRDLGVSPVSLSDDTSDLGLVMFGAILDPNWRMEQRETAFASAV